MAGLGRRIALVIGSLVAVLVILCGGLLLALRLSWRPSKIVDFHPTPFQVKADAPFFYSIGDELKYSDYLDPSAPTLMRGLTHGRVVSYLVSPDSQKIALVSDGKLLVVDSQGQVRQVAAVDTEFKGFYPTSGNPHPNGSKPIGQHYFKDHYFQWSRDSKSLYVIGDEYYATHGGQTFSDKGELWRYDLDTASLTLVLKPFRTDRYFLGPHSGVYFSTPSEGGGMELKYFDGKRVTDIEPASLKPIPTEKRPSHFSEPPFRSFDESDYENFILPAKGLRLVYDQSETTQDLKVGDKAYLTFKLGNGIEGSESCSDTRDSAFLPGDRYLLVNTRNCGNYSGQLLIDTADGRYQSAPPQTRVYITLNTDTYPHYAIYDRGLELINPR